MKNISLLEKSELLHRTQELVEQERMTTMELIECLREIDRRLLFLELGYSSLFEFSVRHLGLSEGSAQRRISAMRLVGDIPEAKGKLESGEISLSNASQIQSAFRASLMAGNPLSGEEKMETLKAISGKTQKECQSMLLKLLPESAPKLMEREWQVGDEIFELKLGVPKELRDQMEELKLFLSHTLPDFSALELIRYLVGEELKRQKKKRGFEDPSKKNKQNDQEETRIADPKQEEIENSKIIAPVRTKIVRSRKHIANSIRRAVWKRAEGRCEAVDLAGRCASRYRLELDHIVPHARDGADDFKNLRLVFRAHNFKHAIESYGEDLMENYRR